MGNKIEVINQKGLHARASARLAELCENYDAIAYFSLDGVEARGDSIMGLMMLGASKGTSLDLRVEGDQANEMEVAIRDLFGRFFDEGS